MSGKSISPEGTTQCPELMIGLAVSGALLQPGERRTHREIAAFCDCSHQLIHYIEINALKKVRNRIFFGTDRSLRDEREAVH